MFIASGGRDGQNESKRVMLKPRNGLSTCASRFYWCGIYVLAAVSTVSLCSQSRVLFCETQVASIAAGLELYLLRIFVFCVQMLFLPSVPSTHLPQTSDSTHTLHANLTTWSFSTRKNQKSKQQLRRNNSFLSKQKMQK